MNAWTQGYQKDASELTYPCCVFTEVAALVLYAVGVSDPLQKLHFFYYVLPFLPHTNMDSNVTLVSHVLVCACVCRWCSVDGSWGVGSSQISYNQITHNLKKHEERELRRCDLVESQTFPDECGAAHNTHLCTTNILIVTGVEEMFLLDGPTMCHIQKTYLIRLFTAVGHLFNGHHLVCAHIPGLENTFFLIPVFTHLCKHLTVNVLSWTFTSY